MELPIAGIVAIFGAIVALVMHAHRRRQAHPAHNPTPRRRRDSEPHGRRAQAEAELEAHDIDDMLDAIVELRRRLGRRGIGEELGDELMRGTWDEDDTQRRVTA